MKCQKCKDGYVIKNLTPRDEWYWLSKKYSLFYYDVCDCCGGDFSWCEKCEYEVKPLEN